MSFTALANLTLSSAASSITFGSIPNTYRDLFIVFYGYGSATLEGRLRFNGDTGTNYHWQAVSGTGSSAEGSQQSSETWARISRFAKGNTSNPLHMSINISEYTTGKWKIVTSRAGSSGTGTDLIHTRWTGTSAVTSITILTSNDNWAAGSSFSLYGIS